MNKPSLAWFSGKNENLKILFATFLFICLRSPKLLIFGRLFAEEGTVYFQTAWSSGFWSAFLAPHQGYYSLLDNAVAAITVYLIPLSWVAFAFTFSALLLLLLMVYVVITCEIFETTQVKLLAALICVISPSLEVWLTLEDCQFCLAVCAAIILLSDEKKRQWVRGLTLLLAGLTGPVSCAFLPFYWIRAVRRKTKPAVVQALILTASTSVEIWTLLHALRSGERALISLERLRWLGPVFLIKTVTLTLATRLSFFLFLRLLLHHYSTSLFILCWLLATLGFIFLARQARINGSTSSFLFLLACWSFLFAYAGIAESSLALLGAANRYFFVPDLLIWLMIVLNYQQYKKSSSRQSSKVPYYLLVLIIASGLIDSAGYWKKAQNITPAWRPQIARWRADPTTPISVSPTTWPVQLILGNHRHAAPPSSFSGPRKTP
ncbi:MAG TPA: hypothetical protein VIJ53_04685 [Acidobacteriaceae bacterium]